MLVPVTNSWKHGSNMDTSRAWRDFARNWWGLIGTGCQSEFGISSWIRLSTIIPSWPNPSSIGSQWKIHGCLSGSSASRVILKVMGHDESTSKSMSSFASKVRARRGDPDLLGLALNDLYSQWAYYRLSAEEYFRWDEEAAICDKASVQIERYLEVEKLG